jgi:hypothetical protein
MWWIRSVLKIGLMAANASRRRAGKPPVDVAGRTSDCHMRARQREVGERIVIKLRVQPAVAVHAVALRAVKRETQGLVRRVLSSYEIVPVACNAFGAETREHGCTRAGVACLACDVSMRANQGKTVRMLIRRLPQNRCPRIGGVALTAVFAHLAAMKVGMTRGTILRRVREYGVDVTGTAVYRNVRASKRISRLAVVIELGVLAQSLPT